MIDAQNELRAAYTNGATGVFVSGIVWLVAGLVWQQTNIGTAFTALFFGGMAIMPLSMVISRTMFGGKAVSKGNSLERLGLESTFILFGGLFVAYVLLKANAAYVFPVLAIIIGTRYFVFRTLYGEPYYWALAAIIALVGGAALLGIVSWPGNVALVVGVIELVFAALLLRRFRTALPA